MSEKPIHVKVAEALGWERVDRGSDGVWRGLRPGGHRLGSYAVPFFGTDWSTTGPLIDRLKFNLGREDEHWLAWPDEFHAEAESGATILLAVCNLILALSASGNLRDTQEKPR